MRKVKFKNVKELYDGSGHGLVLNSKITPVSKGGSRIQGPADEIDSIDQLNMGSFGMETKVGSRHFPSNKFHMKEKSGTCHVCSTPCSSFMHAEQLASLMETKADDELSDEACQGKAASRCFSNDADPSSPSRSSACNGGHHTSSEISNLLSACSSYDSFSENAESKATTMASKIEMLVEVHTVQTVADSCDFPKAPISHGDRIFSNQLEEDKESQRVGETISCVSGSENMNMMVGDYNGDIDKQNASCSSASGIIFPALESTVNDQPASRCLAHFGKVDSNKYTQDCSHATTVYSNKSDLSEISSTRDLYVGTSSLKGEPSECSDEQVESSLKKGPTFGIGGQIHDTEFVKPANEMNDGDLSAEATKCSVEMEPFGKSNMVVEELNKQKPSLQLQPVDCGGGSDIVEDEVKVCDICGNAGREELLAICSKCSDGAEHTYCMRVKLDKVPEDDWMCEECVLREESEKHKPEKFEKAARVSKASLLKETKQNSRISGAFSYKKSLELDIKGSGVEKSRTNRIRYACHFSAKRPVRSLEAIPVAKQRALETSFKSSRVSTLCSKNLMCRNSSLKNSDKGKVKPANEVTSRDHSSNSTLVNESVPAIEGDKSPKLQPQYSMSRGSLMKSQSLNIMDSRKKFQLSEKGGAQKQKFSKRTATSNNKREGVDRLCKSKSFNNSSSDHTNATDSKDTMLSFKLSLVNNLKRLRHAEEHDSTETKHGSKLHNPLVGPLAADSGVFASMADKKITPPGETILQNCSRSSDHDLNDDPGHVKSSNLSKLTSHPTNRAVLNEEQNKIVNDLRQDAVYSTGGENNSNATSHSDEKPSLRDLPWFASAVAIPSLVPAIPQPDSIWKGEFEIQSSGRPASSCHGIQAHLSTCASPKVAEVVHKLPQKFLLEEVSCFRTWPTQFLENQSPEDNIALYFFATDLASYERNYKSLLESMIQNDLALRGTFDGVELLIFSSNLLSEKSRRWNNLLFLWGVFRGRRVNCSEHMPSLQQRISLSSSSDQDLYGPSMSGSLALCSSGLSSESGCASDICYSAQQTLNPSTLLEFPPVTSGRTVGFCESKVSSPEQKSTNFNQRLSRVDTPMKSEQLSRDVPYTDCFQKEERSYNRKQAIDLNCCNVRVDEERECKRVKSIFRGDMEDLEGRFPFGTNGLAPRLFGKDLRQGQANDASIISADLGSVGGMGLNSVQLSTYEDWLEPRVPNLELSLGVGKDSAIHGVMSACLRIMDSENNQDKFSKSVRSKKNSDEDIDEALAPLSLSLASPFSDEKQVLKPDSEMKLLLPEWHGVNTSLSL